MDYECTANEVSVFETGLAAPGCSEVSQAATSSCRLHLLQSVGEGGWQVMWQLLCDC